MIPLIIANRDTVQIIKKIGGNDQTRRHLADLGFTPGASVTVINSLGGNLIVKIKESRVAINQELAKKIMV